MKAPEGKWLVSHGIHDGTLTSRDLANPLGPTEHESEAAAREAFAKAKEGFAQIGCVTWFAYMYDDQGKQTELDAPIPYR